LLKANPFAVILVNCKSALSTLSILTVAAVEDAPGIVTVSPAA
tara:strand:- start:1242 stop:1370 length:129 start_codon:yes stop_codon:yes gene_type:complete